MEHSAADLCSRCASIPWDHLEHENHSWLWGDEKPTLGDLQTSPCRLCRFIAFAITQTTVRHVHLQSVVKIHWERDAKIGNTYMGHVYLYAEDYVGELSLTTKDSLEEDVRARFLDPKRADFAKILPHIEACKASHEFCEPETSPQLANLRVIDCIDNVVVVSPIGCSFVALSYVWGELSVDSYVLGSQIAFPPTIEDAVRSTRELGYQYLWVDRYVRQHTYSNDQD